MLDEDTVVIRGGGDIASGIACRLYNSGYKVIICEISMPTSIRRKVSFSQAVYDNEVFVEEICGKLAGTASDAIELSKKGTIPIIIDPSLEGFRENKPYILVDAILAKENLGTAKDMASMVIGVGPGFTAGLDVDAVVETMRGHYLGKVIFHGSAKPNTGIPGLIAGYGIERVIKSPAEGRLKIIKDIGAIISPEEEIALVGDVVVKSKISGVVRGMIQEGFPVLKGMKIADIDPRADTGYCSTISDKARSIGGGVLEAILNFNLRN